MGLAAYEIIGNDAEWRVRHDGKAENIYETKEAAFEAAVAAASLALRQGHEVRVTAPGTNAGGTAPALRSGRKCRAIEVNPERPHRITDGRCSYGFKADHALCPLGG